MAALAQPVPAETAYVERRVSPLLIEPLRLSGVLRQPARGVLEKTVDVPYVEATRIADGRVRVERAGQPLRQFSLRRAPELAALTASFEAVLSGDISLLTRHYALRMQGGDAGWRLELHPQDARLAKRVEGLTLLGRDLELRCMDMVLAGGETSRLWLGAAAIAAATASDDAARDALCGAAAP